MKSSLKALAAVSVILTMSQPVFAETSEKDTIFVPARAVVLSGDRYKASNDVMAIIYSREDMAFDDPAAPRFLFLDRQGKMALGIGGYVKATASYDLLGAIDNAGFETFDIPVPFNPAQRQRFGADVSHSTIFLKMVGKTPRLGNITVYIQTNFTGNNGGYGLKLKQAYVQIGHLTAGYARSSFSDAAAQAPTIDPQGPSGQTDTKNLLFQYRSPVRHGFSAAISAELPAVSVASVNGTSTIAQRVPDIPLFLQYAWNSNSHVRVSAVLRTMYYRDDITADNRLASGWGVKLSSVFDIAGGLNFFGHCAYGHGIGHYINDLDGNGFDLVGSDRDGRLRAPAEMALTAGLKFRISPKFFVSGSYSRAQVYDNYAATPATYRYGQYAVANAFYEYNDDFRVGVEFIHGNRCDTDGSHGKANRFTAMVQYSF